MTIRLGNIAYLEYINPSSQKFRRPARFLPLTRQLFRVKSSDLTDLQIAQREHEVIQMQLRLVRATERAEVRKLAGKVTLAEILQREIEKKQAQINTDPLTGLNSRKHFNEILETELAQHQKKGQPLSWMLLDIDTCLREITAGPSQEKEYIKAIAQIISHSIRQTDIPCCWGSEVFEILFPRTTLENALPLAQRIKQNIESADINIEGQALPRVKVSIGIASTESSYDPDELKELIHQSRVRGRACGQVVK